MNLTQLKTEVAKIPESAPTRPLWLGVVEELERLSEVIPGDFSVEEVASLRQEIETYRQPKHIPGFCTAPVCERNCANLQQETTEMAKQGVAYALNAVAHWGGPDTEAALATLQEAIMAWNTAGKPETGLRVPLEQLAPRILVA